MEDSSESLKIKKQVRFVLALGDQSIETAKKPKAVENTTMTQTLKRQFQRSFDVAPTQTNSDSRKKKKKMYFQSMSKLKNLAKSIKEGAYSFGLDNHNRKKQSSSLECNTFSLNICNLQNLSDSPKKIANPTNLNTSIQPNSDYAFDQLFQAKHKLRTALHKTGSRQFELVKKQISKKQEELESTKKKHKHQRQLLIEQIQILTKCKQDSEKSREQLNAIIKRHQVTIERLEKELQFERNRLEQKITTSKDKECSLIQQSAYLKPRKIVRSSQKPPFELKKTIAVLQNRLKRAERLNERFQGIICDLHLTNVMYRQQLDNCGYSKTSEFLLAEKNLKAILKHQ